ncbi:hypothetical protein [Streptomyces xylophagus]|uniref:hypothetical protein n=1 Tax=Streptomyces xylophagus TaxID=285514 RepID=UPI0005BE1A1C|nr:hypothetical protein [Streptomyces xylophagus]
MTDTGVPPMPPMPSMPPTEPSPPAKKPRTNLVIIGSAVAVIAAVVATGAVVVRSGNDDSKPTAATSTAHDADPVPTETPDPEPTYAEVDADSFTIGLKTTSRHCFGSAGCNVTVEPDLSFLGDSEGIDPDAVYEITYEIHGDESGPVIETAELSDRTNLNYTPSVISTASAGTELSVEITDVSVQGS